MNFANTPLMGWDLYILPLGAWSMANSFYGFEMTNISYKAKTSVLILLETTISVSNVSISYYRYVNQSASSYTRSVCSANVVPTN